MKTILKICLIGCFTVACNDNERQGKDAVDVGSETSTGGGTSTGYETRGDNNFENEMSEYRLRINERIQRLENEIEELRRERKAEKDQKKWKNQDDRIRARERRQENFRQWLNKLENQTEAGWENFKSEVDDLFNDDNRNGMND